MKSDSNSKNLTISINEQNTHLTYRMEIAYIKIWWKIN